MFKFDRVGIDIGESLVSTIDQLISVRVVDNSHVELNGERHSLSSAAIKVLGARGIERKSIQGTKYWLFRGQTIAEIADNQAPPTTPGKNYV